ncbi:Symplekin tight junction protein C terminal-domain-containing protein [Suillus clintonianus]|uniref:Symplekin tight junction protein C terminal-domain-containing protein n=1 Tax=Suillus clintonianus TaxID=1904413 RepID=UPI001B8737FE|nr:Symplekin tight junction protein C terminal-domain-containing protein [Suillus clintonianus]KAG2145122.1 Symplekin tight junction protein C terminal-domain-containing protein [Suillus clintonianus]
MAGNPVDPLHTLSAALAVPADSKEQADILATLRESLEAHPNPIPILCTTLIKTVSSAGDSLLKRWVLDLLHFAISRSNLSNEVRTQLASQSVETLASLLHDSNARTVKVSIQCLTTVYPLLFRSLCTNRTLRQQWDILSQCKARILEFIWSPNASSGVKVSAIKFMQRIIIVQTRGISDPRLQNKNDPNISNVPVDHPFLPGPALEAEGMKLLESVITMLYTSQNPELLSAILHSWSNLVKQRPALVQLVVSSLSSWTPAALSGLPAPSIKSVEKAVRILLIHISRGPHGSSFGAQINEALSQQVVRMERASAEEKARKAAVAASATEATRKRPSSAPAEQPSDPKRMKVDADIPGNASAAFLASFDFTTLPISLITDLIVANLQAFTEPALLELVQAYKQSRGLTPSPPVSGTPQPAQPTLEATPTPGLSAEPAVKDEPVDPLQMDIDEEEMEYEPDRLNMELSGDEIIAEEETIPADLPEALTLDLIDSSLLGPKELTDIERNTLMRGSVGRIWDGAEELKADSVTPSQWPGASPTDMWMLLIVRMVTRVAHLDGDQSPEDGGDETTDSQDKKAVDFYSRQDNLRQTLCDYIMADFPSRLRLVTTWMNEEWYNDRIRMADDPLWRPNYESWLNQVVSTYQTVLEGKPEGKPDGKDKAFARFLLDLPSVPPDVLGLLRDLSVDPDKMHVGFTSLREFVLERPSLRAEALQVLLELTTHPDPVTRRAAINTVRRWVPGIEPMDSMIRDFALQILRRLQKRPPKGEAPKVIDEHAGAGDENMEDGQLPSEDLLQTPYLPEGIELPAQKAHVLQHVELLFALSVKIPEFLDEIFTAYGQMELTVQAAVQDLITALIKSLGSSNGKLLTLMRTCPPGSESLALRVLTIFTEHGRPSAQLVALVKGLISDRDLDARFLIPIIAEMDKPDILKYLPRIVSILNGQQEPKNLVRSVFSSVVTTPPQTFGSVSSNLPRVRQSELLTPAELMVLLHEAEKEIGLKSAIEAIGVCFSMTDVFRSEILAVVMQQIVDEPVLPVLFLRTVIQAVTTYRTLVGFVSTTLLSRLITKKIWQNPHLWEGFIRCAKVIAPASFGALLQLPKEQLRELVDKQPSLKSGLREYVTKRAGNKARVAGFLDIFGEDDDASPVAPATPDVVMASVPA